MADAILRLFVAFDLAEATRRALAVEARRIARAVPGGRPVPGDNLHLTLAFLGATPESAVPAISTALRAAALGPDGRPSEAPVVRVAGLGAFPDASRPNVLWAGLEEVERPGTLSSVARRVVEALSAAGHGPTREERFHPHVTIVRVDRRAARPRGAHGVQGIPWTAEHLQSTYIAEVLSDLLLMVSERDGPGVRYRPLVTVPLRRPGA